MHVTLISNQKKSKSGTKACLTKLLDKKQTSKHRVEKANQQFDCFLVQTKNFESDLQNFNFSKDRLAHCLVCLID